MVGVHVTSSTSPRSTPYPRAPYPSQGRAEGPPAVRAARGGRGGGRRPTGGGGRLSRPGVGRLEGRSPARDGEQGGEAVLSCYIGLGLGLGGWWVVGGQHWGSRSDVRSKNQSIKEAAVLLCVGGGRDVCGFCVGEMWDRYDDTTHASLAAASQVEPLRLIIEQATALARSTRRSQVGTTTITGADGHDRDRSSDPIANRQPRLGRYRVSGVFKINNLKAHDRAIRRREGRFEGRLLFSVTLDFERE